MILGNWKCNKALLLTLYCVLSFCIGIGNAIKSGITSDLSVHSNVEVACLVAELGSVIVIGIYDSIHYLIYGPLNEIPTWREGLTAANISELVGGFLGFIKSSCQIFSIYYLGASLIKVLLCLAEVLTSVGMDMAAGVYSGKGTKFRMMILIAVFFLLAGAGIVAYENSDSQRLNSFNSMKWIIFVCPLIAGFLRPVQSRINMSLSRKLKSKIRATEWSLGTATCLFMVGAVVNVFTAPGSLDLFKETLQDPSNWWMFTAGPFLFLTVFGSIALPPLITLGSHYIILTSGQLTMALYLDSIGAFTFERKPATTGRIIGTLLTILGAVFSRLPFMLESRMEKDLEEKPKYYVNVV